MNPGVYEPYVLMRYDSVLNGSSNETLPLDHPLIQQFPILQAFLDDDEIQIMVLMATDVGWQREFRKVYKK